MKKRQFLSMALAALLAVTSAPVSAAQDANTKQITLNKGASVQLEQADSADITYEYTSDNEAVATVNENGEITAVGEGDCDIITTAYYKDIAVASIETDAIVTAETEGGGEETGGGNEGGGEETGGGNEGGGETGGETGGDVEKEETVLPEGITTFVFDGTKVTVIEGSDTNYAVVNKDGDDVDAAGTDEDGNDYYVAEEDDVVAIEISKKAEPMLLKELLLTAASV